MKPLRPSIFDDAVPLDGRGRRTPRLLRQLNERDALIRQAARFYPGVSDREAARQIRTKLLRYQQGAWRRERAEALCPPRHADKLTALLWRLLKVRDAVPSERTIRMVLGRSSQVT